MAGLLAHHDSGAAILTLADSTHGNTLTLELLTELLEAIENALGSPEVRVIVLRSDGADFCLGMDLASFSSTVGVEGAGESASSLYGAVLWTLFSGAKPVVTVIRGSVKAGGVGLAAASDAVLATPEARFQLSEVYVGMIPATVLPYLLALRMPVQKARYLVLTAKEVDAEEARRLGLVDELVPPEELEYATRNVVRSLLRSSPEAIRKTKAFSAALMDMSFEERRRHARETLEDLLADEGVIHGIDAYRAGELPEWFGTFKPDRPVSRPEEDAPNERMH